MHISIFLACVVAAVSTSASAQDGSEATEKRTVAGAQQFLKDFHEDHVATAEFIIWVNGSEWLPNNDEKPSGYRFAFLSGDVSTIVTPAPCKTVVSLAKIRTKRFFRNTPSVPLIMPKAGVSRTIDWSRITGVRVRDDDRYDDNGTTVKTGASLVQLRFKGGDLAFLYGLKEDAQRVAFGMDFLREQCSTKSETGF